MIQTSQAEEIAALRRIVNTQWSLPPSETLTTTPELYGTVTGFFNKALEIKYTKDEAQKEADRKRRCKIIAHFIGRPIDSFKRLTHHECTTLVDYLKAETEDGKLRLSESGANLIRWAEVFLEDNSSEFLAELEKET